MMNGLYGPFAASFCARFAAGFPLPDAPYFSSSTYWLPAPETYDGYYLDSSVIDLSLAASPLALDSALGSAA